MKKLTKMLMVLGYTLLAGLYFCLPALLIWLIFVIANVENQSLAQRKPAIEVDGVPVEWIRDGQMR